MGEKPCAPAIRLLMGRFGKPLPWYLAGCFIFLYLHLFRLPWTPIFSIGGEHAYLVGAMRMLEGQTIYRDFFDFLPPGTHLVYFLLFKLVGVRAWIPNLMLIALGVWVTWLLVVISRKVVSGPLVFLPGLVFLTFSYRLQFQLDATHHWYSALAVLGAVAVAIEARSAKRLIVAGALCGLGAFFTQTRGALALAGLAVFLVWEAREKGLSKDSLLRSELSLLSGFLGAMAVLFAYFVYQAGLERVLDCTLGFLFKYSTSFPHNNWAAYLRDWPAYHPWYRLANLGGWLFINLFPPVVYILCLWQYRGRRGGRLAVPWDRWMLLYLVGVFLLLGSVRAPNTMRITADSVTALVLLAWLLDSPGWLARTARQLLWVATVACMILTPIGPQRYPVEYLELPAGRTAFYDRDWVEPFQWLLGQTRPGEHCLAVPLFNFYLHLRDPSGVPFLTPTEFTRPEQVSRVIDELDRHQARLVVWFSGEGSFPDDPNVRSPEGDHLGPLRAYVREHYRMVKTFFQGEAEAWERQP
jgi:hypothetical protein